MCRWNIYWATKESPTEFIYWLRRHDTWIGKHYRRLCELPVTGPEHEHELAELNRTRGSIAASFKKMRLVEEANVERLGLQKMVARMRREAVQAR